MLALCLLVAALHAQVPAPPDPGFQAIVERVGQQSHDASVAQMQAWVDAHARAPDAGRGLIWMAELRLADHRLDLARPYFERAARDYPQTEWGYQGLKGVADIDVAHHRYAPAIATYDALARLPLPYWEYVGRMAAISARQERLRWWLFLGLSVALCVSVVARLRAARQVWPPPEEATWALPVALVMLLAALGQPPEEGRAVITVAVGAVALLWAHGAQLRARPPGTAGRIFAGATGLLEAAALLYCAVIANDLWLKFAETLTSGAER